MGAKLIHSIRRTDMKKLTDAVREYGNASKDRVRGLDSPGRGPEIMTGNCDPWHSYWSSINDCEFPAPPDRLYHKK